jgi:DNA replication protein DnaC
MTSQKLLNKYLPILESKYDVNLDDIQIGALESLLDFVLGSERSICLSGKAGCGKTLLLSMLNDILSASNYVV